MQMTTSQMTTKTKMMSKRASRTALLLAVATLTIPVALLTIVGAPQLLAQSKQKDRTVDGKVVSKAEANLPGSVVYLKDTKSLSVKTYICDEEGKYHFGALSQNTDYELWATSNGVKSNTKSISSFDSKNSYYFVLTVAEK
jgi:hypothetical protein